MAKFRFLALQAVANRKPVENTRNPRCSEIFGEDVFSLEKMRHYLSIEAYKRLERTMLDGSSIDRALADQVAAAMKAWALERGVTHYTHWFHPLNGATAENAPSPLTALAAWMRAQGVIRLHSATEIMITPGYRWRTLRGLITNFHQPQSTLLLLVSALIGDRWREVYKYALEHGFRFLSYGDSSLLLPERDHV